MMYKPLALFSAENDFLAFGSEFAPDTIDGTVRVFRILKGHSGVPYEFALSTPDYSTSQKLKPAQQKKCKQDLKNLLETAGKPDWDGEGADPVTEDVIKAAEKVIDELPGDSGVPEISADPEGNVEFDWHLDNGTMFTVCIGQTGIIVISGLHPTKAELTVTAKDNERVPSILRCGLEWLNEMKSR